MNDFGELKRIPLREIWSHEANDFTPWLAANMEKLGEALGLQLELTEREAPVDEFSLDLLATDLNSGRTVIIENQLNPTDHGHLGQLLTYAAGRDASTVIWIAEEVRNAHRQALEWLNQKTGIDTQFFAVVVEGLQIDDSRPALDFKPVVFPNEWQKSQRLKASTNTSPKLESYREYFQRLIDELREGHDFTRARAGQAQNWYTFSSGMQGIKYLAWFTQEGTVCTAVQIDLGDARKNGNLFDALEKRSVEITSCFGGGLKWERLDAVRYSLIAVYRDGTIESPEGELQEIRVWQVENLLKLKEVFTPEIKRALETIDNAEL